MVRPLGYHKRVYIVVNLWSFLVAFAKINTNLSCFIRVFIGFYRVLWRFYSVNRILPIRSGMIALLRCGTLQTHHAPALTPPRHRLLLMCRCFRPPGRDVHSFERNLLFFLEYHSLLSCLLFGLLIL